MNELSQMIQMPSPAALFGSLLFGIVGFAAFMYGKKSGLWKPLAWGVALMVYPYFVSQTWLLYLLGCTLSVGLLLFRD